MPFALRTRTPLLPAALAFVSFGFVLVRVRVLRFQARDVAPWWIPELYRRLIDTECRQVCEGTGDAVLEGDAPATPGSKVWGWGHRRFAKRKRTVTHAKPRQVYE